MTKVQCNRSSFVKAGLTGTKPRADALYMERRKPEMAEVRKAWDCAKRLEQVVKELSDWNNGWEERMAKFEKEIEEMKQ